MIIRPVQETDVERISQLWMELVQYHRQLDENMPIPAEHGARRYAERLRYSIEDHNAQVYVAEVEGDVIGYVYGIVIDLLPEMFIEERAGMVGDIYVAADWRTQGAGKALMKAIKQWFKLRGVAYYELYVAARNDRGVRFWQDTMGGQPVMMRMRASVED